MKTVDLPLIEWRKVEQLDQDYVRRYWAELLLETGGWQSSIRHFMERNLAHRHYLTNWVLAIAVQYVGQIEDISQRMQAESLVLPLPMGMPGAARSAAPA